VDTESKRLLGAPKSQGLVNELIDQSHSFNRLDQVKRQLGESYYPKESPFIDSGGPKEKSYLTYKEAYELLRRSKNGRRQ